MFNSPRNENFNLLVQIKSLNIEKVTGYIVLKKKLKNLLV